MGNREINMSVMATVITAIAHYNDELPNTFANLNDKTKEIWDTKCLVNSRFDYSTWKHCNIHIVNQMWSNTSGGWQTMGGSAMTNVYTTVIENRFLGVAFIYYDGRLAYISEMDNVWWKYAAAGYQHLPGMNPYPNKEALDIVYKSPR